MVKIRIFCLIFTIITCSVLEGGTSERIKLSDSVNTEHPELSPVIADKGRVLFFARTGDPANAGFSLHKDDQDIWVSRKNSAGIWQKAVRLKSNLNNSSYNYPVAASSSGNILYLAQEYSADGSTHKGLSYSRFNGTDWSFPIPLKVANYYNKSVYASFSVPDGSPLIILAANRRDTEGLEDLYVSFRRSDGSYSEPVNLGTQINTESDETTPLLADDLKTLYFSSNRLGGQGSYDLYFSRRLDESWKKWSRPRNLGTKVNTMGNDLYISLSDQGTVLYTVNSGDIYRVHLPEDYRPDPIVQVHGSVSSSEGSHPDIQVKSEPAGEVRRVPTDRDGGFGVRLPGSGKFRFSAAEGRFYGGEVEVNTAAARGRDVTLKMNLQPVASGSSFILKNIAFHYGSSRLVSSSTGELQDILRLLQNNPELKIEISGHTDNVGSAESNRKLSLQRALAVKEFLVRAGIGSTRIRAVGMGETRPVASNATLEGRKKNRRVEFRVL